MTKSQKKAIYRKAAEFLYNYHINISCKARELNNHTEIQTEPPILRVLHPDTEELLLKIMDHDMDWVVEWIATHGATYLVFKKAKELGLCD